MKLTDEQIVDIAKYVAEKLNQNLDINPVKKSFAVHK
jgi:hypothetical protein